MLIYKFWTSEAKLANKNSLLAFNWPSCHCLLSARCWSSTSEIVSLNPEILGVFPRSAIDFFKNPSDQSFIGYKDALSCMGGDLPNSKPLSILTTAGKNTIYVVSRWIYGVFLTYVCKLARKKNSSFRPIFTLTIHAKNIFLVLNGASDIGKGFRRLCKARIICYMTSHINYQNK